MIQSHGLDGRQEPVSNSAPVRTRPYTPAELERVLPLIRSIATSARETYLRVQQKLADVQTKRSIDDLSSDVSLPEEVRDELAELNAQMRELTELGARFGDPELGVVIVDGRHDDVAVNLCWKLGEASVRTWYPIGGTYADRRPL